MPRLRPPTAPLLGFALLLVAVPKGRGDAPAFAALVDGATANYQAYVGFPETGETSTVALSVRMRAVPGAARELALHWTFAASGEPVPTTAPYGELPRRLVVGARGLSVDAYRPTLPASFEGLRAAPARVRAGPMVTYVREGMGCFEVYSPGASDAAYRALRACFAGDGILREFVFDSARAGIELAGPVTLPQQIVGSWTGRATDRTFRASLALDGAGRISGTYVTTAAWATECTVVQIDDVQRPESVAVHLRCEERLGGDQPSVEHADCAFSLVGGELVLDRCAVEAAPLQRVPAN